MQDKSITISTQSSIGFLTVKPMLSHEFRRHFSSWISAHPNLLKELPQLHLLFQRGLTGERLNTTSPFRFQAQPSEQWLHGIGPEAASLIEQLSLACQQEDDLPHLVKAITLTQQAIKLQSKAPQRYTAPQLIVCKNAEQNTIWNASSSEQKLERIASVLEAGINRQIDMLRPKFKRSELKPSDVSIQYEWSTPKLQSIHSKAYVRVVSCTFTLPCTLHGSWAAGPLTNKGFGCIGRS